MSQFLVSPHTHPESPISGSTVDNLIKRAKMLGRSHFSYTDVGTMTSLLLAYKGATKAGMGFIPGIEIYFKDPDCPIVKFTKANKVRYYKTTLYAHTQEEFAGLCRLASKPRQQIESYGKQVSIWNWKDLEEAAGLGLSLITSDVQDLIFKNVLIDKADLIVPVYNKLKSLFKDKISFAIVGSPFTKTYKSVVSVKFTDGSSDVLDADSKVKTNASTRGVRAVDLATGGARHSVLIESIKSGLAVKYKNGNIKSAEVIQGFLPLGKDIQLQCNKVAYALGKSLGVRILYSDFAFYAEKDDKLVQDVRLSGENFKDPTVKHMQSTEEARAYLGGMGISEQEIDSILSNNSEWAKTFDSLKLNYGVQVPLVDNNEDALQKTVRLIKEVGRMPWGDKIYEDRLRHEISVLAKNGTENLLPYFFPIKDVIDEYAKAGIITGPGRGSAAGCLLAFLIGITHVDPIKYGLQFERFLSLDRIKSGDWPDIDTDLPGRELLVGTPKEPGFLYRKWGNKAAQVSTRTMLRLKSSLLDVNRFIKGDVEPEVEILSKNLPAAPQGVSDANFVYGYEDGDGNHHEGMIELNEDLRKYSESRPEEWAIVERCLGVSRQFSAHASAFLIGPKNISERIPMFPGTNITQYEAKGCSEAGAIKYDFLVVNQLNDIQKCLQLINKKNGENKPSGLFSHNGKELNIWSLPEDLDVFKSVWNGDTETLFQINSVGMADFCKRLQPKNFFEGADILALQRPGALDYVDPSTGRNMAEEYIERKYGRSFPDIPELEKLLPSTYGIQCLSVGTRVKTLGGIKNIESVLIGDMVQTETGSWNRVTNTLFQGVKKTIKVHSDNGQEMILTEDHKVLTNNGWKAAGDLNNKDLIRSHWASDTTITEGDEKDYVVGLLLADGDLCARQYNIAAGQEKKALVIKEIVDRAFSVDSRIFKGQRCWYVGLRYGNNRKNNPIIKHIKDLGLHGLNCHNKKWPEKITKQMILGYLDGDGNWKNRTVRTCNYDLALGLFESMQAMRVKSYLHQASDGAWTVGWGLDFALKSRLSTQQSAQIREHIGLVSPVPDWNGKIPRDCNYRQYFYPKRIINRPYVSTKVLKSIGDSFGLSFDNTAIWSRVLSIKQWDSRPVYDLTVDTEHSFLAGGLVVHNCYQEQNTLVAKEIAGMDPIVAEQLRRALSKKKKQEVDRFKPIFIKGATEKVGSDKAEKIWAQLETSSRYNFNLSHAMAYFFVTYATMFLRYHYPLEWWASVLSNADEKEISTKLFKYVATKVTSPDINLSTDEMTIDYATGKILSKLTVLRGVKDAAAGPIIENRPYKDIEDFVRKDVAGPLLTKKLIYVDVMNSLFKPGATLEEKLYQYELAKAKVAYDNKVAAGKKAKPINPDSIKIDRSFLDLHPIDALKLKKSVLPTMPVDLMGCFVNNSKLFNEGTSTRPLYSDKNGRPQPLIDSNSLQIIIPKLLDKYADFCVVAYVIDSKEFSYQKGAKSALKMVLDINGFMSEFVMWPDYNSGKLDYPKELKKGDVILAFMKKRPQKPDVSISQIIIHN